MRGTAAAGSLYVASTLATRTLEDVAAAAPAAPKWFQLYVHKDRELTMRLVARARAAGYGAIVVTCDVPVLGRRCADVRNGFALPDGMRMANLEEELPPELRGQISGSELARFVAERHDPTFGWEDLRDLADACAPLPLVVKGICRGDDARRAIDHGARAIWVSNHGGRQLDLAPSSADSLAAIASAVPGAELYVDGGIRSGTHALVALALGATAVFVGRPVLWGLATSGAAGVERVLRLLASELVRSMQLAGARDLAALRDDLVQRRR
jgi:4-hydroxymandelate oxidase